MTAYATIQLADPPSDDSAFLLGTACGALLGLAIAIGMVVYLVRRSRAAPAVAAAPCPKCGAGSAKPVTYAWWGGLLGPKLLSHVECTACGTAYNGKTGQSNAVGIAVYIATTFTLACFLFGGAAYLFFAAQ
jgi:hypothetical protein